MNPNEEREANDKIERMAPELSFIKNHFHNIASIIMFLLSCFCFISFAVKSIFESIDVSMILLLITGFLFSYCIDVDFKRKEK